MSRGRVYRLASIESSWSWWAFAIGSRAATLAIDHGLNGFATRIAVSPTVVVAVRVGALVLATGTVFWQSLKAARTDLARVLRSE